VDKPKDGETPAEVHAERGQDERWEVHSRNVYQRSMQKADGAYTSNGEAASQKWSL
jgi:hypothetical protein